MKVVIPSAENKLCAHFGHCEYFTFVDVDDVTKEILSLEKVIPDGGVSCGAASWIAEQDVDVVLAGGMGGRPMSVLQQNGIKVIAGCPEMEIRDIVNAYLEQSLVPGENSCGGEHHHCHGHGEEHHCGGHNH